MNCCRLKCWMSVWFCANGPLTAAGSRVPRTSRARGGIQIGGVVAHGLTMRRGRLDGAWQAPRTGVGHGSERWRSRAKAGGRMKIPPDRESGLAATVSRDVAGDRLSAEKARLSRHFARENPWTLVGRTPNPTSSPERGRLFLNDGKMRARYSSSSSIPVWSEISRRRSSWE